VCVELGDEVRIEQDDIHLLVMLQRAMVEVRAAHDGEIAIDRGDLGVQHRRREDVDLDAGVQQEAVVPLGGELGDLLVVVAAGDGEDQLCLHAPPCCRDQGIEDHGVGSGVRRVDRVLDAVHDLAGREHLGTAWPRRLRGLSIQVEAECSRAYGDDGPEAWRRAMTWCDEHGPADTAVYLRWRLAEALLRQDDRDDAAAVLRQAHKRAAELGAWPLQEELEALARRARIRLPGVDTLGDGGHGLTPRERDVLALLAQGLTNRAIGEQLYIAESTASVHVSHILTKLEVSNRGEAAALAHRLGLAPSG